MVNTNSKTHFIIKIDGTEVEVDERLGKTGRKNIQYDEKYPRK